MIKTKRIVKKKLKTLQSDTRKIQFECVIMYLVFEFLKKRKGVKASTFHAYSILDLVTRHDLLTDYQIYL